MPGAARSRRQSSPASGELPTKNCWCLYFSLLLFLFQPFTTLSDISGSMCREQGKRNKVLSALHLPAPLDQDRWRRWRRSVSVFTLHPVPTCCLLPAGTASRAGRVL